MLPDEYITILDQLVPAGKSELFIPNNPDITKRGRLKLDNN